MPSLESRRGPALFVTLVALLVAIPVVPGTGSVAHAQLGEFDLGGLGGLDDLDAPPGKATFETELVSDAPQPGGDATLRVTVELPRDNYIYSMTNANGAQTKIDVKALRGLESLGSAWTADREPKHGMQKNLDGELEPIEKFVDHVTWSRKFRIAADAGGTVGADLLFKGQYCSDSQCIPILGEKLTASLAVEGATRGATSAAGHVFAYTERPSNRLGESPAVLAYELSPEDAKPGDEVTLSIKATVDVPWHVYSTTMEEALGGGVPTAITVAKTVGLEPIDEAFVADREPEAEIVAPLGDDLEQQFFEGEVTWTQRFRVTEAAYGVEGTVKFQTCCEEFGCKAPMTTAFALGAPVPVRGSEPPAASVAANRGPSDERDEAAAMIDENDPRSKGLVWFLLFAAGAGFFALLTPCVFPMVPITISYFLKQAEKEHTRPVALASVYAFGIIATFTGLGLGVSAVFGAAKMTEFANNPWLNTVFGIVLLVFAASLLGMFDIRMPSWLVNWTSGKQSQGGYLGALFMAFTFTLMSFTCTFAFAALLLLWASQGQFFWPVLGMLAFSTAFALPFFILALVPGLLKQLPKSGGWMNTVKVTMGMIEVAAAFKFLSIADVAWNPAPIIFDYTFVMCGWLVIAICAGLYLLGTFRLGHDTPTESISVPRLGFAMGFLGVAAYLAVTLFAPTKPEGLLATKLAAFAPPQLKGGQAKDLGPYLEHDGLKYALDVDRAIEFAQATNTPIFLDFTGVNCANCREIEEKMTLPRNRELLEKFVRVQLFLDKIPVITDASERERILDRNIGIALAEIPGGPAMPTYAFAMPNGELIPGVAPVGHTQTKTDTGLTEFLERGLQAWERIARDESAPRVASRK